MRGKAQARLVFREADRAAATWRRFVDEKTRATTATEETRERGSFIPTSPPLALLGELFGVLKMCRYAFRSVENYALHSSAG